MFFLQIAANSPYPKISNKTCHVFYFIHGVKNPKIPIHLSQVDQKLSYVTKCFKNGNV